jgi:hypothetical protein
MKIIIFLFCTSIICFSQTQVSEIIKARMKEKDIPGFAFIISKDDKIIEEGYYGLANVELQVPVTPTALFWTISLNKN